MSSSSTNQADNRAKLLGLGERSFHKSYYPELRRRLEELQQMQDALQQAKEAAERANAAKDRFMATLSHELRTPLTPVLLNASVLQEDPSLPEYARHQIAEMRRHVEMEARLIDDLLDLTRIAAGKLELQQGSVDLHRILELAINVCRHDLQEKHLHLDVHLDTTALYVQGDAARLQQVFWNLIKNGIKFTASSGRVIIRSASQVDPRTDSTSARIEVQDTGIGMSPEIMARIFNVFEQGSREITRLFGGLGMGLSISRAIVEMHHGTIEAFSDGPGKGSRFVVTLPCASAPLPPEQPATPNIGTSRPAPLQVLLVEDHDATGRILKRLLQQGGHHVTLARDLASARSCLESQRFELLISDIGLPDGNGWELGPIARKRGIAHLVALSGFGMDRDLESSRQAGFDRHLTKPVDFAKLQNIIAEAAAAGAP